MNEYLSETFPKVAALELVTAPDPRLRMVARAVEVGNRAEMAYARELGERMKVLCRQHDGVGLAANQVGVLLRVIVVRDASRTGGRFLTAFNPVIFDRGTRGAVKEEGCLSHPGVRVRVWRAYGVRVRYETPRGNLATTRPFGLEARIFQHEIDHLDGISIVDKVQEPAP